MFDYFTIYPGFRMFVNIRSELVPSPWAYAVRPEWRENENYKILVFSLLFFDVERLNTEDLL